MRIVCLTQRAGWARRTGVCLALAILCTQAYADPALRHFDIQSQVASLALKEFARQADISLVFSSTVVAHHQTAGLRGDFTVIDGLQEAAGRQRAVFQTGERHDHRHQQRGHDPRPHPNPPSSRRAGREPG